MESVTHQEIRRRVTRKIFTGWYDDGDLLPSTRQLSKETGAHCQTIAKAYSSLIADGVVEKVPGKGMRLCVGGTAKLRTIEEQALKLRMRELAEDAYFLRLGPDETGKLMQEAVIASEREPRSILDGFWD
jgi:DNA-binding transcriptional regulator YhcF (GntR family)